jgi:tRNA U55 pseudouridine synthase TruB
MGALLRVGAGPFALADCVRPDQIAADPEACLIDPLAVLRNPRVVLDDESARRFVHGNQIRLGRAAQASREREPEAEVLVTCGVKLLGCARLIADDGDDALVPTRVLSAPDAG